MTKQHFIYLANYIKNSPVSDDTKHAMALMIIAAGTNFNGQFSATRFLTACGLDPKKSLDDAEYPSRRERCGRNNMNFFDIYREELARAVREHPEDYMPGTDAAVVADKMIAAMKRGNYNKDGRAFKATCKRLGIKHTYQAINAKVQEAAAS